MQMKRGSGGAAAARTAAALSMVLGLALHAGCGGSSSRALLPVDIQPGPVVGIKYVVVTVTEAAGDKLVRSQQFDWSAGGAGPLRLGVYLPDGFSGQVAVQAEAFNGAAMRIGRSNRGTSPVVDGQLAPRVTLTLAPATGSGDGGADAGDGGAGSDGGGGGDGGPPPGDGGLDAPGDGPAAEVGADLPPPGDANIDAPPVISASWKPGMDIEMDPLASSFTPDVAIDGAGNVLVAWREGAGVKLRRMDGATRAWGAVKTLEDRGTVDDIRVAVGAPGQALAVWFLRTADAPTGTRGIWASHSSDAGLTWSPPARIHDGPVYYELALAMGPGGGARVAWQESMNNINSLWCAYFDSGTRAFTGAAMVLGGSDADERYPRLAVDDIGRGLLTWVQDDSMGQDSVWGANFLGPVLSSPQLLDSYTTDSAGEVDVAIAPVGGRGLAVWQQRNGSTSADLWAAEWVSGQGWQPPARVLNAAWVSSPAVAIDPAGNTTVAFTQPITGYKWNVIGLRRPAGGAWTAAAPLETTNQAAGRTDQDPVAHLAADAAGNVHAVWRRKTSATDDVASVIVRRFGAAAGAWEPEVVLGAVPMLKAYHPEIAVAPDGRAAASFYFLDPAQTANLASFNVYVALYH
jgi:hypothetical protein